MGLALPWNAKWTAGTIYAYISYRVSKLRHALQMLVLIVLLPLIWLVISAG